MSDMPSGWIATKLADVVAADAPIIYGILQPGPNLAKGVPYVRPTEIVDDVIAVSSLRRTSFGIADRYRRSTLKGDDVILSIVGTIGKVATVPEGLSGANITQSSCRLRPEPDLVLSDTLAFFLRSPLALSQFEALSLGTAVPRLNLEDVRDIEFPLAPLTEQRRIVAKIGSLCAKSKRSLDHLNQVRRLVEKYKQAILAAAFQGDLTKDWRAKSAKHYWPWPETSLSEIGDIGTGSTPKRGETRYYSGGHIPWVTSGVVNNPLVQSADEFITDAAIRETNCKVFPAGTLLMAMYGEGQTRGRVAVLGIDAATNQALAAIQVVADGPAVRDFVFWHLRSGYLHLRQQAAGGVQPNLNLGMIKGWRIPLPSRDEQHEVVRRIEVAFGWIDRLASEATNARKLIDHLDRAILAKAFQGELVPQDPSDEPASALLERIRTGRAKGSAKPSKRARSGRWPR